MVLQRAMSYVDEESGDWEETVKPASRGIRVAMLVLNGFLVINGIILIILGIRLNHYVTTTSPTNHDNLPPIWVLGILPILLGLVGIVCVMLKSRKWVVIWLIICVILGVGSFMFFAMFRFLDPSVYGINIQIFGDCEEDGTNCKCLWDQNKSVVGLLRSPCRYVRTTSSLFLGLVFVFTLSTASTVICAILGCVLTFCLRLCAPKEERPHELHSTIYGANTRPSLVNNGFIERGGALYHTRYFLVAGDDRHENNGDFRQNNGKNYHETNLNSRESHPGCSPESIDETDQASVTLSSEQRIQAAGHGDTSQVANAPEVMSLKTQSETHLDNRLVT